ncbi:hypothetical protein PLICRDRAFT_174084 [Plicaturopsis crispa FD-325 SS-3]|nr:hypothetical protein PLICRDRAFT_174084 [Plicaturopsis crispa FD-325 SS-3]
MADAPNVSLILGPVVTAVVLNTFLFGLCILQFTTFYTSGIKTKPVIRLLVGWVLLLDTYHTITAVYLLWIYTVTNFNNPDILDKSPWPFPSTPIVTVAASIPIQHYLAWRIKKFSKSWIIFGMISLLSWAQGIMGITSAILALMTTSIDSFGKIIPFVDSWLALAMICDLSITGLLAYHLRKSRTGFQRTDNVITGVIRSSVETAAFALFFCIMDFICFSLTSLQGTNFHLIFALPMGRIYTNTLLTTLNSRSGLRDELSGAHNTSGSNNVNMFPRVGHGEASGMVVTVQRDAQVTFDDTGRRLSDVDRKDVMELASYPSSHGRGRDVKAMAV